MALLRTLTGPQPGQLFPLQRERAVLGRHPDCDIVLESGSVSRHHARIVREGDDYFIEDLESRNGTFVNGQPVVGRRRLDEGDELDICDLTFVFHRGAPRLTPVSRDDATDAPAGALADPSAPPATPGAAVSGAPVPGAVLLDDAPRSGGGSTIMSKVDVSSGSAGLRIEVNPEAKLKALIEIGKSLGNALNLNEVLPNLLASLFTIFPQADRGFVILKDPTGGRLVPRAVKYRRREDAQAVRLSRTIVQDVICAKEAILSADAATDARFDMAESIVDFQIRSMMCAPMVSVDGQVLGVIQVDTVDPRRRFNRQDLDVLAAVACQAAAAVETAQLHEAALRQQTIARELAVAHQVQQNLLPRRAPRVESYEFFAHYEPANEVGGDYYDYVALPGGRVGVVVADVSGKGVSASLLMARLSAETRFCLALERAPASAVGRLNRVFCEAGFDDRFVTLVLCVLDPRRHEVAIVNAGHVPPLVRRRDGRVEPVGEEAAGLPIGVSDTVDYEQSAIKLAPGETIILLTDGVTEAMNDQEKLYGIERVRERLSAPADDVAALGRRLVEDVKAFAGGRRQSDDICLACFGRRPKAHVSGTRSMHELAARPIP